MEIQSGAAPLGADLHRMVEKRLKCPVVGGYGMSVQSEWLQMSLMRRCRTESTCVISLEEAAKARLGSVGVLLAGMEGRVVDGEMQLKGPNITTG